MTANRNRADRSRCKWINGLDAFRRFATHTGGVQSARHIKPLHWYIACRLVLEGGFMPEDIMPRPPFDASVRSIRGRRRFLLSHVPASGGKGESVVLGGLKTKNVDVVVTKPGIGPVIAVSCKGVTKAFRNLTNRMEETIGECTNLHITYPAMVIGYFALVRANRTIEDAIEAPSEKEPGLLGGTRAEDSSDKNTSAGDLLRGSSRVAEQIEANDIAILPSGVVTEGIVRFHAALCEMTGRRGIRDEISRYEAMSLSLVEPKGDKAGTVFSNFPSIDSPLRPERFFETLYRRYEERFVYGAPLLADRGITTRVEWAPASPAFARAEMEADPQFRARVSAE